jgi:hypothetical protein
VNTPLFRNVETRETAELCRFFFPFLAACLDNEELHNLYCSPSVSRMIISSEMGMICSTNSEKRNAYRILKSPQDQDVGG